MEKRINLKIDAHVHNFKQQLKCKINESVHDDNIKLELLDFIFNFPIMQITSLDLQKRKRVKNIVPLHDKCCAKRANGEQCTRRKKNGEKYCGTHIKGTPHGIITDISPENNHRTVTVFIQEIQGIQYYIDTAKNGIGNVYDHADVFANKVNPKIIAKYHLDQNGIYSIPTLFK
jgi:hypothetical protein